MLKTVITFVAVNSIRSLIIAILCDNYYWFVFAERFSAVEVK